MRKRHFTASRNIRGRPSRSDKKAVETYGSGRSLWTMRTKPKPGSADMSLMAGASHLLLDDLVEALGGRLAPFKRLYLRLEQTTV